MLNQTNVISEAAPSLIKANWPVSDKICAYATTRLGGQSSAPYSSLNLADHVNDDNQAVQQNRDYIKQLLQLPREPFWLKQVHGTTIHRAYQHEGPADASYTDSCGEVLAIMTADCLPVLLTNKQETKLAAIHAGWRGLAANILAKTKERVFSPHEKIIAWLGPAIGPQAFEVGPEVRDIFCQLSAELSVCFKPSHIKAEKPHYLANIYEIARFLLQQVAIKDIYGGEFCTVQDQQRFFSYRREGLTGRMATLCWRQS